MNDITFNPRTLTIYCFMLHMRMRQKNLSLKLKKTCHANWVIQNSNKLKRKVPVGALIDPNLIKVTQYLKCNHSGTKAESLKKQAVENDELHVVKRRNTMGSSIKVGCLATLVVKFFNSGKVTVVYNWRHNNHNPLELSDISHSRLSEEARIWINEHVEKNLDWKAIKGLLRLEDIKLEEMENSMSMTSIPSAMMIQYKDVHNAIVARINNSARKHYKDEISTERWIAFLQEKGYQTMFDTYNSVGPLLFLENAEEWYLDSTHKTCKSFLDNKDCYLMSVIIYNPVTNKGVPVAFFVISIKCSYTIARWLNWLKDTNSLKVKWIMIDCSPIEQKAIRDTFGLSVQILLCHWHIKRAWESHVKKVTIPNAHLETKNVWANIRAALNLIMHSNNKADYNAHWQKFRLDYGIQFPGLMSYMEVTWEPKKKRWVKAWRQDAVCHTNNLIESYHNQLKSFYLGQSCGCRIDKIVYVLSQLVERDYRQDTLETYFGIKSIRLSVADTERKRKVNVIAIERANGLVEEVEPQELQANKMYSCKSFGEGCELVYFIKFTTHLHDCSCPDSARLCKHIFLVSQVFDLPVTVRRNVILDSATLFSLNENNGNIISEDNIVLLENQMSEDEQKANILLMNESLERI
ncbi:hypothetical protein PHYBLDRAFT_175667 [Phycomyces blakesleeanus NRRL 1555(-)]|uniref:SWIM-type domain-containing protein n=1 Tax=Phycomyces blakesleeanus (strain ATCC 8743b / DSM 1359 / FGSC 10004 / NBRC 33097 / NRRL 1555) TaxID=763407 RepID=A0A167JG82_PHYB8|nr:hypothetical protein PHYBLDRAFT_175667 [Phycomyces blakesleeanus NRRL 1555(-)]OAD65926.1 hypothetical protein PHYBLDRAFT_175667 [Phycomyces blakesleeanus NRRL 1555(-)]|eukprot:XP_018283966.1 hypothetical protein PHYBLDRAFT_175667 [Phycomyces blakesleeanus NRRL 1555(-)]